LPAVFSGSTSDRKSWFHEVIKFAFAASARSMYRESSASSGLI
jgi:hypothetical protein